MECRPTPERSEIEYALRMIPSALTPLSSLVLVVTSFLGLTAPALAQTRMPAIFTQGAVLQREAEVRIWGWSRPGDAVSLVASWPGATKVEGVADDEGRFELTFETPEAGGPYEVAVSAGTNPTYMIRDVWLGEVWICSGQSNMEWTVGPGVGPGIRNWEEELLTADQPKLRLFNVPNTYSAVPERDCDARWMRCTPETARTFSATAYFFGRELAKHLDCTVALVESDWGGTVCEAWTSPEGLEAFPEFERDLEAIALLARDPGELERKLADAVSRWWEELGGKDEGSGRAQFMSRSLVDDSWEVMALPAQWEEADRDLGSHDGIVWFRKSFELGEVAEGDHTLELCAIDDMDTTWVNGRRIGGLEVHGSWNKPRRYTVPSSHLRPGENVIAVRVLDTGGAGGFFGEASAMRLVAPDGAESSLAGDWRYRPTASLRTTGVPPSSGWFHHNSPTALFHGMISPLLPLSVRGVIWYQGESNRMRWGQYRELFPAMIADWRRQFQNPEMPFYFVQIAPFDYGGDTGEAALLRDAQRRALRVPHTGMAVTMDIGDPRDIHPANKQDVGRRLALWALARDYGHDELECSGPLVSLVERDGANVIVTFEHGEGLSSRGATLEHFTLAGADGVYHPARARIVEGAVHVRSEGVGEPRSVRFGGGAGDGTSLWNAAGLPAASFVVDVPAK